MNSVWFFEDTNLFKVLCPHRFKAYKKDHNFDAYKKKDYIYFTEDSANKVFLIEKGKVKIGYYSEEGDEVVKAILSRGQLFGEKAILGVAKRDEFAQSIDNTTSICPIGVFLDELCTDYGYDCPDTGDHIIKHPYTQKDIASLIGTSRPTLNILLNELKESNIIDFNRKEIRMYKATV